VFVKVGGTFSSIVLNFYFFEHNDLHLDNFVPLLCFFEVIYFEFFYMDLLLDNLYLILLLHDYLII